MNPSNQLSPHEEVLKKIEQGDVHMRSRAYFLLRLAVLVVVAVAVFTLSALIASFIFFSLSEGGEAFLLQFGDQGIRTFLALFPWTLFIIDLLAVVLLRFLLAGVRAVYRVSFLTTLAVIVLMSIIAALLINLTPLHSGLRERANTDDLPLFDQLYEDIGNAHEEQGEFRGTIISISDRTITIMHDDKDYDEDDGIRIIVVPEFIDISDYAVGDRVYIGGETENGVIRAYGMHGFPRDED